MASPPEAAPSSSPPPPPSAPAPSNATSPPPLTPSPSSPPPGTSPPSSPPPQDAPLSSPSPPSPSGTAPSASPPAPPAPKTPSAKSPPSPTTSLGKSSPPPPRSTSPSPPDSGSNSIALYAGLAVAAGVILLILSLLFLCCKKKRRRRTNQWDYHGAQPPVPSVKDDYPGDPYGGAHPQGWQNMIPPPPDNIVKIYPPSPPPSVASRPPQPPPASVASRPPQPPPPSVASRPPQPPPPLPPIISATSGSSVYSEPRRPPPPPGIALGFSKCSFTYEELLNATDGFSTSNLLGQGGFGYVHKGILGDGEKVAVKQLKSGSVQGEREFQAEVDIISRVHHKHLVSMIGYCISGDQRLLVYEFIPNNTLEFHLHGKGRPTMDWPTRLRIALGSAKGLAYLHEDCHPRIIHRDIKASNILLDFKFEPKVADFGLAKLSADNNSHVSTRVMGTFGYLAPEYASSGKLTEKSDVFSFGVVLLELITGRRPVDVSQTYMDDSLVDWARPLLTRALEEGNFEALVDPKLHRDYNNSEMARMVACAASAVRHSAKRRPQMGQIVRALEGVISLDALNEGVIPGHSSFYGSHGSSDYEAGQYGEQMRKLRKMAFANSGNYGSSVQSIPTSEYGLNASGSSSEGQPTREFEMTKTVKKGYGL